MKNRCKLLWVVLSAILLTACNNNFDGYETFVKDFEQRATLLEETEYLSIFDEELSTEQRQALQFLYAYMPLPDVTDYSGEYYLSCVDYALKARREMAWGKSIPDREWLHFVLPIRVNNENLDECRGVFYEELKERVMGLSMYDAVLEINHWCHEKVTYTPSDSRTSSPLATIRTAHGRCGEESTFTVSALRAMGIPARQVYTPRWAHTDDNHAWVEAWVDGKWYFLGACEPEPVLNLGWFNAPASRGMLMHTRVYGNYNGNEETVKRTACYTEINVTANYAPTVTTHINVTDKEGNPVDASVEFKIYNYAELYTVVSTQCDKQGRASITTGLGDLVAWAAKDGMFGFAKISAGKDNNVTIVLDKSAGYMATLELDIVPPAQHNTVPELTAEQVEQNKQRFAQEDSIRNAYVATFPTEEECYELAQELNFDKHEIARLIKQSRGNYATIISFLRSNPTQQALDLLWAVSEKDRRDITLDVLNDHYAAVKSNYTTHPLFTQYILNPRVSNERLTTYRSFFNDVITSDEATTYRNQPELWVQWCRDNISVDGTWNPRSFCMSPQGVWSIRTTDSHSRDIFFVSVARSMGIAARIDEVTGKTQYWNNNSWCDAMFNENTTQAHTTGILQAQYTPTRYLDDPRYYTHFTISKIVDEKAVLQNYPESATWQSLLSNGTTVDTGDYLVMSGTRMANGSVLARLQFLQVNEGTTTHFELVQRQDNNALQVIGNFNSENLYYDLTTETQRSILSTTGRGYYIIALIEPNSEPTNHFLRDVMPYKEEFEKWGQKIVLLFDDTDAAARYNATDFANLPNTVVMGTDIDRKIYNEIVAAMKLQSPQRPIILVADTFNRIVFLSQGYSIGLGEQLIKVINQLNE